MSSHFLILLRSRLKTTYFCYFVNIINHAVHIPTIFHQFHLIYHGHIIPFTKHIYLFIISSWRFTFSNSKKGWTCGFFMEISTRSAIRNGLVINQVYCFQRVWGPLFLRWSSLLPPIIWLMMEPTCLSSFHGNQPILHRCHWVVLPSDFAHMNMVSKSIKKYTYSKAARLLYHILLSFCTTFSHPYGGIVIK